MSLLRLLTILFGIGFLAIGVMGYMPAYIFEGNLFGYFHVSDLHNAIHVLSGVLALLAAASGNFYSKLFFQVFGLIYGLLTVLGFVFAGDLFIMHVNMADNVLHLIIAVLALYFGFIMSSSSTE